MGIVICILKLFIGGASLNLLGGIMIGSVIIFAVIGFAFPKGMLTESDVVLTLIP